MLAVRRHEQRLAMIPRVAMVTAAAHRCGKQLVRDLAKDGFDVAVCSLALLKSRVKTVESLGRRACALRLLTSYPPSAAKVVDDVHRLLGRVHTLIHIDGDSTIVSDGSLDATTAVALPDLVECGGTVMFLFEHAMTELPRVSGEVNVMALSILGKCSSAQICSAIMQLLREGIGGAFVLAAGRSVERAV